MPNAAGVGERGADHTIDSLHNLGVSWGYGTLDRLLDALRGPMSV